MTRIYKALLAAAVSAGIIAAFGVTVRRAQPARQPHGPAAPAASLFAGAAALALTQAIVQPILQLSHPSTTEAGLLTALYDFDRIISRTLSYAIVTGLLVGLYAGLVLLATQVLTLTSQVGVAAAALAAAALFNPLRRRVQRLVDRRFNRARYDADNTVASFAARLQDTADPADVRSHLIGTVHHALEPATISLWTSGPAG